jgi:predicted CXXCH cytochrome family protein
MRKKRASASPVRSQAEQTRAPVAPQPSWKLWLVKTLAVILALGAVGSLLLALVARQAEQPRSRPEAITKPLTPAKLAPPEASSPFLNTRADAHYVGSQACTACHAEAHAGFQHTGMARSMAAVDPAREPADGAYFHEPSGKRYEVQRREGQMWHREFLRAGGEDLLLQEFPVKYVTGSGRHALTYVVETEGFLVESPITWYASRQAWGMSPGYDRPNHSGFQREVGEMCLVCHAGQVEPIDRSLQRVRVLEASIGCERCHGPGSLHIERRSGTEAVKTEEAIDHTIVNPAHLPRELAEAICQQCHLRTSATVLRAGRRAADFRPGLPLHSVRHDYTLEDADRSMTVVGHVEQMHRSACYQGASSFTCVTCHDPHHEPSPEQRAAHYRAVCLKCHDAAHCTVDPQRRARDSAENNCVQCHMPTGATDIPHLAFTHHRVGIHEQAKPAKKDEASAARLIPFLPLAGGTAEAQRCLGIAYFELALHETQPQRRRTYQQEAWTILKRVCDAREGDGVAWASLASLTYDLELAGYEQQAAQALADPRLEGLHLANALFLQADAEFSAGRYRAALAALDPLSKLRRHSLQWLLAAQCEQELGNAAGVERALLQAVTIDPSQAEAQQQLAGIYRRQGKPERAQWHERRSGQPK